MIKERNLKKYAGQGIIWTSLIILFIVAYYYFSNRFTVFKDPYALKELILSFGHYSIIVFVLIQILQVIVFFIPGEVVQIVGGYVFGPILGSILSSIGIITGSFIGYYIAKILGRNRINNLIEKRNLTRIKKILDAGSNRLVILIIYFIPGIPKDLLVYVAGISKVTIRDFIVYSSIGRVPWIIISAFFGHGVHNQNYLSVIIIAVVASLLFLIGVFRGHKIIDFFHDHGKRKIKKY